MGALLRNFWWPMLCHTFRFSNWLSLFLTASRGILNIANWKSEMNRDVPEEYYFKMYLALSGYSFMGEC